MPPAAIDPAPDYPVTWFDAGIAVAPATRSLRRAVERAEAVMAEWTVVVRLVEGAAAPLFYALRTDEVAEFLRWFPARGDRPVDDALPLGDGLASLGTAERLPRAPLDARPDAPWSRRLVQVSADGVVVAVGEAEVPADLRGDGIRIDLAGPADAPYEGEAADRGTFRSVGQGESSAIESSGEAGAEPLDIGTFRSAVEAGPVAVESSGEAAAEPPADVDVELSAQAPAELAVGQETAIEIQAALAGSVAALASRVAGSLRVRTDERIAVLLSIRGDAVVAVDSPLVRLDVPTAGKPVSVWAFGVRGVRVGVAQIAVVFRQGGTELGSVVFPLRVVAASPADGRVGGSAIAAAVDPDDRSHVLLLVDDASLAGGCAYRYRLVCDALGWDHVEFVSPLLKDTDGGAAANVRRYVEALYKRLTDRVLRNLGDTAIFAREVKGAGTDLARQLLPPELVRLLWDRRAGIGVVEVKSWEPYVPWELLRLEHPDTRAVDDRFLAEYGLIRSLNGTSRPQKLALGEWRYLIAEFAHGLYAPLVGDRPVFTELVRERRIAATPIDPLPDRVYDALAAPDFDVLHICCHGKAEHDDIERSQLILGDRLRQGVAEPFLVDATTVRAEARLEARHPLVFLNACASGRLAPSLTAWGGWPRTFWDTGAGAFVGTSWPVRDEPARAFCEAFYGALIDGKTLAAAADEGRAAAKAMQDASWLAYKVYGRPSARAV